MLLDLVYTIGGFILLVWGADRFVGGAAGLANRLGVPPILIGVTIVGFGTSAPEIMVSASAAAQGLTSMAVGNALGSNIANVGLVLGATALARPITAELSQTLTREVLLLVLLTAITALLFIDNALSRVDALLLICGFCAFMGWVIHNGLRSRTHVAMGADGDIDQEDVAIAMSMGKATFWLLVGLLILLGGANLLVLGAVNLARHIGVSELVIGLTIIAIGTSLPEFAVSVVSAIRGSTGLAIGNIIGSNIFNLLAVIGVAGLVHPTAIDPSVLRLHYPVMLMFTLALLPIAYNPFGKRGFGRATGLFLLAAFIVYQAVLLGGF
jgi:cation:H+ antiporter